jgi:poly(A) polymerase
MPWQENASVKALEAAFARAGFPLFYVGGCVRDTLLGRAIGDVDAATPATPEQVQHLLDAAGIRHLPTGIEFGTVSALLPENGQWQSVEITTFREDIATNGRHAEVKFGTDMSADAARRDFTINALYLASDGTLHDPTGQGKADIEAKHLRFIGDPAQRITEDALRILRFYRFAAQLGLEALDAEARAACRAAAKQIQALSGERIQSEMRKLLAAVAPARAWDAMREDGVLAQVVIGAPAAARLDKAASVEETLGITRSVWLRLAYLLGTQAQADSATWVAERWRLSRKHALLLVWLVAQAQERPKLNEAALKQLARERSSEDALNLLALAWLGQTGHPREQLLQWSEMLHRWEIPEFPVRGQDLLELGYKPGALLGRTLARLTRHWEEEDYQPDRAALLAMAVREKGE